MSHALSEKDRTILTRLEEDMWRESTRFDRAFQERRFAADFFEFGRSGRIYTRDQIIRLLDIQKSLQRDAVGRKYSTFESYEIENCVLQSRHYL